MEDCELEERDLNDLSFTSNMEVKFDVVMSSFVWVEYAIPFFDHCCIQSNRV